MDDHPDTTIRPLIQGDAEVIAEAFAAIGWDKPASQYKRYLSEQERGTRSVLVAETEGCFSGYVTIQWSSGYQPFLEGGIPEIQDFNVLPQYRRRRIGTRLMNEAEQLVSMRASTVGIGVGMYPDYGNAQRLYVLRGYIPDGRGLAYGGRILDPMERVTNDDDLVLYFTKQL